MDRIDNVTEPAEVGRRYLVPTVHYPWFGRVMAWPVIGPRHEDRAIIGFSGHHYHVDGRFLSAAKWRWLDGYRSPEYALASNPLMYRDYPAHPAIVYKRLLCTRAAVAFPDAKARQHWLGRLEAAYADKSALRPDCRLNCPHKGAPLDSLAVDENGIVTCPLHGLRWHRDTGLPAFPLAALPAEPFAHDEAAHAGEADG